MMQIIVAIHNSQIGRVLGISTGVLDARKDKRGPKHFWGGVSNLLKAANLFTPAGKNRGVSKLLLLHGGKPVYAGTLLVLLFNINQYFTYLLLVLSLNI
jgi:hypothetical protein